MATSTGKGGQNIPKKFVDGQSPGRITAKTLRESIEAKTNQPYQETLSDIFVKLLTDFRLNKNTKEFLAYLETMNKRLLQDIQEVHVETKALTNEEMQKRINSLVKKL